MVCVFIKFHKLSNALICIASDKRQWHNLTRVWPKSPRVLSLIAMLKLVQLRSRRRSRCANVNRVAEWKGISWGYCSVKWQRKQCCENNKRVINSLWPSDTIYRHRSGSTFAHCPRAPSHYLKQCWLIISEVQWQSPKGNFTRLCFYQTRSAWSVDQGSNINHSPAYNFEPTVTKSCVMWEGLSLPHDTKFGNCRYKIVDSRAFPSWSLIHGLRWSGLIKAEPEIPQLSITKITLKFTYTYFF